jgi:hypothetical protein
VPLISESDSPAKLTSHAGHQSTNNQLLLGQGAFHGQAVDFALQVPCLESNDGVRTPLDRLGYVLELELVLSSL